MATYRLLALHLNCISGNEKQQSALCFKNKFFLRFLTGRRKRYLIGRLRRKQIRFSCLTFNIITFYEVLSFIEILFLNILNQIRLLTFAACAFWRNHECLISANTCRFFSYIPLMPYKSTQLPESCKGYHRPSTDLHVKYLSRIYFYICLIDSSFRHYVFTQILRCSHAVLDCASLKAEVWSYPDMSGLVDQSGSSVWNRGTGAAVDQLPGCSASFLFTLIISSGYLASHFD
ncbi:hypothetical protein T10_6411 [Trichinella papuae]|uniref:Uncharacterized protein n=1 Tax=Trichinella papuae TaxID=268474 RepID=A0A0V1M8J4_9BILA|nr:hypothetical protein T10_6411 [Trichinella papuae]